jgi:hypothetical protein
MPQILVPIGNLPKSLTFRTLTFPDPASNASFVVSEGTQNVNGVKTFSNLRLTTTGMKLLIMPKSLIFRWNSKQLGLL